MRLLLLAVLFPFFLSAQTPPGGIYNQDLRDWLKLNWYDGEHTDLGYNTAREQMYGFTDADGGMIECIYTGFQQSSGYVTFPDPINAEHLIPQSFYGSATPMRSDIHNLRPSHQSANSARSNSPLNEVSDGSAVWYGVDGSGAYQSTSSQPTNFDDYSERFSSVWEPREERKGDVARQVFYFYTMYPTQAGPITDVGTLSTFYQWHLDDPVAAEEVTRNDRIEMSQGNRNPYIDMPNLVYDAWLWVASPGCTDALACNYDMTASSDDGSCLFVGDACDDGDAGTTGETIDAMCQCTVTDVSGCTDSFACNYDPLAVINDGSCEFITCAGCTDSFACNFDPTATLEDATCEFITCAGCTDSGACNYDPAAFLEDGTCEYLSCAGCTDNTACNYDASATLDDETCAFESDPCDDGDAGTTGEVYTASCVCQVPAILGCMYVEATNYDPLANVDDMSCTFNCDPSLCTPGDVNGDTQTNVSDLLIVIADFGNNCP